MIKRYLFLIAFLTLAGCAVFTKSSISSYDLSRLSKGMSTNDAELALQVPAEYFKVVDLDEGFVYHYVYSAGSYASSYLLFFDDEGLNYWGYPHDFAKSDDPVLNRVHQALFLKTKPAK